jgi:predicted acyl esterase
VKDGYIFVVQDIRGRFGSEGQFMMNRPPRNRSDANSVDESTDTYDTIDWLIKNITGNNGRAGILGVSYDGWLAAVATIDAHPALKASSPQAPMTDTYLGDDFFHNGAFRQSYGYEYVKAMESSKEFTQVTFDRDAYDWYLRLGSLSKITEESRGRWPTWNAFIEHPNYDEYWKARSSQRYLKQTSVATLVVGGWWDQEDFYGALATYDALEKADTQQRNFVVLGPWNHGGWGGPGQTLGDIDFGSPTGLYFRSEIQAPWFASFLKDNRPFDEPEALTFQSGLQPVDAHRSLATQGSDIARLVSAKRQNAVFRETCRCRRAGVGELCLRSSESGSLPATADSTYVRTWIDVVHVARPGSTFPSRQERCSQLAERSTGQGSDDQRQRRRALVRFNERQRQRLDRETDRRLPGRLPRRQEDVGLPVDGRE